MRRGLSLVFVLLAAAAWGRGGVEAPAGPVQGEVAYLEGDVSVDGKPAVLKQKVPDGVTVTVGAESYCDIVFGRGNVMRVLAKTIVTLDLGAAIPGVRLSSGALASVFHDVKALGSTFRVKTNAAVAGVRGTAFFVQVEDDSNTYVCACNGELGVGATETAESSLASTRHAARRFTVKDGTTTVSSPGLLYHDNAMMDSVASRIGASIPWGVGYGSGYGGASGN